MATIDEKEMAEAVEQAASEDPGWVKEGNESSELLPYSLELFLSTDGKHTVHVTVDAPEARREAVKKAMEFYDYVVARFGTKQAQAVREYGKNGEQKPDQKTCKHVNVKFAQSKTEKNPGRWFKGCKDCGAFLGWQG